ncbi:hypothetical protein Tco_1331374 [Tanacetum coccineum]
MIRGYTSRKRPREQAEKWLDNEISFPSTPVCQLVDSPIILEALIEGFLLKESRTPLVGFSGEVSYPIGTINLNVTMGEPKRLRTIPMEFVVIKSHSSYNVILGRTGLRSLGAVASTIQSMIKFPTANGIATLTTKKDTLHECQRMEEAPPEKETQINEKIEGKDKHPKRPLYNKPPEKVVIHDDYPDQTITIRGNVSVKYRSELIEILRKHGDAFAWTPADMTAIPRFIAEQELKTYPHIEPRVQRKQCIAPDRRKIVKEEVAEWLKAGIVRKVCVRNTKFLEKSRSLHRYR